MKKVIVVGSGVAGLAASVRLAQMGYEVTCFESNAFYGGKINSKTINGYRFDQGPSIYTGVEYLKEIFDFCGEDFSSFKMDELESSFHYFFHDGMEIFLPHGKENIIKTLHEKLGEDKQTLRNYLDKADKNFEVMKPLFIEKSLHKWRSLFGKKLFEALGRLPKYKLFSTMNEENKKAFKHPKTVQIFNRFASYNGSSPLKAPAMLNMVSHLEFNITPYFPSNGMAQITDSLYQLAVKKGVKFRFEEKVDEIIIENKSAKGVKTAKGKYNADAVVSNMDVSFTYEQLLPNEKHPTKTLQQERSSSAIVFYWGIKKEFKQLNVHNIFFADDYPKEWATLFDKKELYDDPTIYVNITSKYVKGDAPKGCENWFVYVNAPSINGQNWDETVAKFRSIALKRLEKHLGEPIEPLIDAEDMMSPPIIEERYLGKAGSIYGNASNNRYSAFYRHPNFSKDINGLYFVGVSVHPGGGIPLALNSARLATEFLKKDLK